MKSCIAIFILLIGTLSLSSAQAIIGELQLDTVGVEVEEGVNPFDVNHIPIRKNQANANLENLSLFDQLERHFSLIVIIGLLTLLAVIALRQRDLIGAIVRSLLRDYALSDLWRNESRGKSTNLIASYFFGLASTSLFLTLAIDKLPGYTNWRMYGVILLCLIGYYLLKHLILLIIRSIYSISSQVSYYNAQIVVTNIMIGGALFFLSIFMSFGPDAMHTVLRILGFLVMIVGLVTQIARPTINVMSDIFKHPFPYFVYLCTLEISPILIIWSLLNS